MSPNQILVEWPESSTALIVIDRTERRNALDRSNIIALTEALVAVQQSDALRTIVLTGNGAFCAGADLRSLSDTVRQGPVMPSVYEPAHQLIRTLLHVRVPTIAAIDGPAVGMGADLALACDCRLIGPEGWIRQGWAAHGVIPATGGIRFLRCLAPSALWYLLDGQPRVDGPTAERFGLAETVSETAREAAIARGTSYAAIAADALAAYVKLSRRCVTAGLDDELTECAEVQAALFNRASFAASIDETMARTTEDPCEQ